MVAIFPRLTARNASPSLAIVATLFVVAFSSSLVHAGDAPALCDLEPGGLCAWGSDENGALGNGEGGSDQHIPTEGSGLSGIVEVSAGLDFTLALTALGTVRAWGRNEFGQLGDGSTMPRSSPVSVTGFETASDPDVIAVAAGGLHSLALLSDGTVRSWGNNDFGQLGIGTMGGVEETPQPVVGLGEPSDPNVMAISAGTAHSVALLADGTLRAWGSDVAGHLGNGPGLAKQDEPVVVSSMGQASRRIRTWSQSTPAADTISLSSPTGRCGHGAPTHPASWATVRPIRIGRPRSRC